MLSTVWLWLLCRETDDTKSFSRFIPLLLFLMQKKETIVPTKLCIMVRGTLIGKRNADCREILRLQRVHRQCNSPR